ncbi:hypothetical protein SAMD00019534_046640 [Acytostelium subglobosum LB1]|uniref:hypothetical protein n=1 Tax=Acytostelium subglobosum LB1 TaxID=1410327 RepID=UPI000644CC29|nr:hypothetical protein SAMD00019534_046640 [Acytostelium subglobosum LB1]GAM21489.1 hypothetical protein SAMD00019534_046640 [Acytostelium subglobosum LB1]|eukprot:XP_012755608.1 hypothetical protein SAMD00019534_046640 [Acytostelium subglobosum LB1]
MTRLLIVLNLFRSRNARRNTALLALFLVSCMCVWLRKRRWFIFILSFILPESLLQYIDTEHFMSGQTPSPSLSSTPSKGRLSPSLSPSNDQPTSRYEHHSSKHDPISNSYTTSSSTTLITKYKPPPRVALNSLQRKRVTLSTVDTVYYEHISDRKVSNYKLIESERDTLLRLAAAADLYLITQVDEDKEEEQVASLLKSTGVFEAGLNPHKLIFCSTAQGRGHISRHLEAYLHIDDDKTVLSSLKPYVQHLLHVFDINADTSTTTTTTTTTTTLSSSTILSTTTTSNINGSSNGSNINGSTINGNSNGNVNGNSNGNNNVNGKDSDNQRIYTCPSMHEYFK